VLRLIEQTLKAGVMDDEKWQANTEGVPQGAVISPLLANIFLHDAIDRWVNRWRGRWARGMVSVVRYADDFVMGFQYRSDANNLRANLEKRLAIYGLTLHPEKTRLLEFGRFAQANRKERGHCGQHITGLSSCVWALSIIRNTSCTSLRRSLALPWKNPYSRTRRSPLGKTGTGETAPKYLSKYLYRGVIRERDLMDFDTKTPSSSPTALSD
jgi:Reverse transcriptase (RNA-dependent DNA polymerase)